MLKIDPEFRDLIPVLDPQEYALLKQSLQDHGCRDHLTVWRGHDIIIDGHNRYALCQQLGIPFEFDELEFSDRAAVKDWIIRNQLGRRNLTDMQRIELALRLKPSLASDARKRQGFGRHVGVDPSANGRTAQKIGKIAGVSEATVRQAERVLKSGTDELKTAVRNGKIGIQTGGILAKLPPDQQHAALAKPAAPRERVMPTPATRETVPIRVSLLRQLQAVTAKLVKEASQPFHAVSKVHLKNHANDLHGVVQELLAKLPSE